MPKADLSKLPAAELPERMPAFPACSPTTNLRFDGRTLVLTSVTLLKTYTAASGKRGPNFSLKAQQDRNLGTIPAGSYWIDPEQMWTASRLEKQFDGITYLGFYTAAWGLHRITIHPLPSTQTYGRGGFFIHGGTHIGSAGCIHLLGTGMDEFLANLKTALGGLPRCSVPLIVKYP